MRLVVAALALPSATFAQTIDFESIPGLRGPAPEGLAIRAQFDVAPYHVRFERLDPVLGRLPVTLASTGGARTAFRGERYRGCDGRTSEDDKPNRSAPFDPGCYFATDDGLWGSGSPPIRSILMSYSVPVLQASGYILDLDDQEEFTLHARDEHGVDVAAPIVLDEHDGSGGNGGASAWFFDVDEPIFSILFDYTGHGGSKGTGFDEVSPATACPGQVLHRGNGTPGLGARVPAISMTCPEVGRGGTIEVFNGAGGVHGSIGVSFDGVTRPAGCGVLLARPVYSFTHVLSGPPGVPGAGRFMHAFAPLKASLTGVKVYVQAGYCDAGSPCRELALTEIIEATIR
jgi:hypothetical protein